MKYETEFCDLIASRLNHDYVAPLTAISNFCELIKLSPNSADECLDMINESVESAIAHLQYYRIAFGNYGDDEELSLQNFQRIITGFFDLDSVNVDLNFSCSGVLRSEAKLLCLGGLCLRSSYSQLESLTLAGERENWTLFAKGKGITNAEGEPRAQQYWENETKPIASMVHFPLFLSLIDRFGFQMAKNAENAQIALSLVKK